MKFSDHTEEFMNQVKDLAVMGLYPPQIAERLCLEGEERREFLMAILNEHHPLHEIYQTARAHSIEDPRAALVTIASAGDTDALELLAKVNLQNSLEEVKKELFDL